jgi:hypothetical protein
MQWAAVRAVGACREEKSSDPRTFGTANCTLRGGRPTDRKFGYASKILTAGHHHLLAPLQSRKARRRRTGAATLQPACAALAVVKRGVRDDLIYVAFVARGGGFSNG